MNNRRSFIVGIKSIKLSKKEEHFLKKYKPWGVILFSRNIKDIKQTFKLTSSIRKVFKDNPPYRKGSAFGQDRDKMILDLEPGKKAATTLARAADMACLLYTSPSPRD